MMVAKVLAEGKGVIVVGSGRQGCNLAGESPAIYPIWVCSDTTVLVGNHKSIAWGIRPGRPEDLELQRCVQSGGQASIEA